MSDEGFPAAEARAILRRLGLKPMEGSNNDRAEIWVTESGHPYLLPYCRPGKRDYVFAPAFGKIVDDVTS